MRRGRIGAAILTLITKGADTPLLILVCNVPDSAPYVKVIAGLRKILTSNGIGTDSVFPDQMVFRSGQPLYCRLEGNRFVPDLVSGPTAAYDDILSIGAAVTRQRVG
jgi:hypothetical protein